MQRTHHCHSCIQTRRICIHLPQVPEEHGLHLASTHPPSRNAPRCCMHTKFQLDPCHYTPCRFRRRTLLHFPPVGNNFPNPSLIPKRPALALPSSSLCQAYARKTGRARPERPNTSLTDPSSGQPELMPCRRETLSKHTQPRGHERPKCILTTPHAVQSKGIARCGQGVTQAGITHRHTAPGGPANP